MPNWECTANLKVAVDVYSIDAPADFKVRHQIWYVTDDRVISIRDTSRLTQFSVRQFKYYAILNNKLIKKLTFLKHEPNFFVREWRRGERKWAENTAGRLQRQRDGHIAADQIPVCWSCDSNELVLYVYVHSWSYAYSNVTSMCAVSTGAWLLRKSGGVC
jgi:hypothetical protein